MELDEKLERLNEIIINTKNIERGLLGKYFLDFVKYSRKFGEKMCLFYQVGAFHECYSFFEDINNERVLFGNAEDIASILNMSLGIKDSSVTEINISNPN